MTTRIDTPRYRAYLAADQAAREAADILQALRDDPSIDADDPRYLAAIEADTAATLARDAALDGYRDSDEPREWELIEAGQAYDRIIGTREDAIELAREAGETGDYGDRTETRWTDITIRCESTGQRETITVTIDPEEPACVEGEEHDWQSPIDLVGGLKENPGVWGSGGGVVINEACVRCGCRRRTDTWAHRSDTGEQGLTSVRYDEGYYDVRERDQVEAE